jgi:bifunctional DNA-binding transcriptional regulator/antitoxin component of YhaV-PrlF toxin-antitoxin module
MAEGHAFLGSAKAGAKGQIVILAEVRAAMQVGKGDKVVVLRSPRDGSILVFRVDSFEKLWENIDPSGETLKPGPEY